MSTALDKFLDQLAMHKLGSAGTTRAHMFLQDRLGRPLDKIDFHDLKYAAGSYHNPARVFIPPKQEDRVIMFADNSGVYVRDDGFCTPMGSDISHEVVQWQEVLK